MASGVQSIIRNIDENFCKCSICLNEYNEPKLLPCLHRFCTNCLRKLMRSPRVKMRCPVCRQECAKPKEGVTGFKTDFYMKSIVDFIQLQKSMKTNEMRECFSCSKYEKVSAYCFKCSDFFCETCHNYHVTSKMMKDHRSHVLSIEDVETQNLTFEKLTSMKDVPRCQTHSENLSQLCCNTCEHLPICVACSFGDHENHDIKDVKSLARSERDRLTQKLDLLHMCQQKLDKMKEKLQKNEEQIIFTSDMETAKIQSMYDSKLKDIETIRDELRRKSRIRTSLITVNWKRKKTSLQEKKQAEIQEIIDKYDKIFNLEKEEYESSLSELQERLKMEEPQLNSKGSFLDRTSKYLLTFMEKNKTNNLDKHNETSQQFENTNNRYENLTSTAASIISAKNDWTAVNCIPDVLSAIDPLIKDVESDLPGVEEITSFDIHTSSLPNLDVADSVEITEHEESVVDMEAMGSTKLTINSITSTSNGNIVISGKANASSTHITVANMEGKVLKQKIYQQSSGEVFMRTCASWSKDTIVTVCNPTEIGVFDISGGSYVKKSIRDVVRNWKEDQFVTCVVGDRLNNLIYVGSTNAIDTSHIYVLNDQLQLCRILPLKPVIGGLFKLALCVDEILVCDGVNNCIYALNMKGDLLHKFKTPDGKDWIPFHVLTDKNGFIYALMSDNKNTKKTTVVQFSQDRSHVLATRCIDRHVRCMAIVETTQGEKLLVPTVSSGTIFVFGLVSSVSQQ